MGARDIRSVLITLIDYAGWVKLIDFSLGYAEQHNGEPEIVCGSD